MAHQHHLSTATPYSPTTTNADTNMYPAEMHQNHHHHHHHHSATPQHSNGAQIKAAAATTGKKQKSKRIRTIFTPEQLKRLEQEFSNQMYLVGQYRCLLAESLNLSEAQVKVWFQNRRIKFRKLNPRPTSLHSGSPPSSNQTSPDYY